MELCCIGVIGLFAICCGLIGINTAFMNEEGLEISETGKDKSAVE